MLYEIVTKLTCYKILEQSGYTTQRWKGMTLVRQRNLHLPILVQSWKLHVLQRAMLGKVNLAIQKVGNIIVQKSKRLYGRISEHCLRTKA